MHVYDVCLYDMPVFNFFMIMLMLWCNADEYDMYICDM